MGLFSCSFHLNLKGSAEGLKCPTGIFAPIPKPFTDSVLRRAILSLMCVLHCVSSVEAMLC